MTTTYEFRVGGHLDVHWTAALGVQELEHLPDGTSTLTAALAVISRSSSIA